MKRFKRFLYTLQEYSLLVGSVVRNAASSLHYGRETMEEMYLIGAQSVPLVFLGGLFIGIILALEVGHRFESFGAKTMVGRTVSLGMIRELGPVVSGLLLAARVGAKNASELGGMKLSEQIDALRAFGSNPITTLVVPSNNCGVDDIPAAGFNRRHERNSRRNDGRRFILAHRSFIFLERCGERFATERSHRRLHQTDGVWILYRNDKLFFRSLDVRRNCRSRALNGCCSCYVIPCDIISRFYFYKGRMGNPLIQLDNVSVAINGEVILENVSLSLQKGETSVILGPSGAGKSSILKVILGLWKPDTGKVLIDATDIVPLSEEAMLPFRHRMAIVFQGNALFDSMTVRENIAYFLREHYLVDEKEINSRVEESLSTVNLEGKGRFHPEELSSGMKKRVAIARAVAFHPEAILYDEPTTGLDPLNARAINDLILKLQQQGTTSVIVTHLLKDAFRVGKTFFIIERGRIVAAGSADEILSSSDPFVKEFLEDMRQVRLAS